MQQEQSFESLLEASFTKNPICEGDIVSGVVVAMNDDFVTIDVGYKSEGIVAIDEFRGINGEVGIEVGNQVEVLLEGGDDTTDGCRLSKVKADRLKVWSEISEACEKDSFIEGTIASRVKGGLSVLIYGGVKAFLPASQVDLRPTRNLDAFIGQSYHFRVIKFNKKRGNIILSRRVLLEKERIALRESTLEALKEGQIVDGVVKNLTEYGAFIDLGGIDGLLHITDMSWGRVNHPSDMFKPNDGVRVKVLKFNEDTERVALGLKQITEDPWVAVPEKYVPGTVVRGKVVSLKDYGAFIELEEGIEGLVHVSEFSWIRRLTHPSKMVELGEMVKAVVLDVDVDEKRVSLGIKQLDPNPYEQLKERYPIGSIVKGQVRNVAEFGVFVEIEEGIDGLVHISDISWTQRIRQPSEIYNKGDEIEAVLLEVETDSEGKPKISLGVKQMIPNPWKRIAKDYPIGKTFAAKVLRVSDFGAFVELEEGIEGLIHISEISEDKINDLSEVMKPDQTVNVQIISIDSEERKIGLSLRAAQRQAELANIQGYGKDESGGATLGDVFGEQLGQTIDEDDPSSSE